VRLLDLVRSLSWVVEREAKVSSLRALKPLEHCWTSSSPCEVFVTLGGVPPRRLGVAREHPTVVVCLRKFVPTLHRERTLSN